MHKRSKKTVAPILKDSQPIDVTTQDRLETSSIEIDVVGGDISGHQTKNANISDVAAIVIEAKLKIKCPCGKSDPTSTHIVCTSCHQSWHNKCFNMNGFTPTCIKKLVNWDCPNCFKCPYMKQSNDPALPLITNSDRVEKYNEDLSEKYNNILHEMKLLNESVLNPCHREAATDDQSPTQHKLDTISENVKLLSEKVIILEKSLETKALSTESVQHSYSKNDESNGMLPNTASPHLKPSKKNCLWCCYQL